ncbi:MAG: site-specific DNA-methyltransferase [Myxococcales bacterium FL481]|nr:MAG: site-specific DNA-methyltransferase [Myxococcales bacterium FL481]
MPKKPDWPASKVEMRPVDQLVPSARNARTHSPAQIDQIAASIREWGWTVPVLVDEEGGVIAGHGRLLAAQKLEIERVPAMTAKGWTEAQKRAYMLADNKLALTADWDDGLLATELQGLAEMDFDVGLTGFDELDLQRALFGGTELDDDTVPEKPEEPVSSPGDLWTLGEHRVLCGDATDPASVERLLDGAKPRLMVTDPPYGVEYDPAWRNEVRTPSDRVGKVANDDRVDWTAVWGLFPGDVAYVWHAGRHCGEVAANLFEADFQIRAQIVWNKSRFALSRGNYHWKHEPCWYAVRKGRKAHWIGDRKQTTVWDIQYSDNGDATTHGTQKPLECMGRPMRHHDAPLVFDPFLGSGTTLVAAHQLGRTCYGIEIDPAYVDVTLLRWAQHAEGEPTLDGQPLSAVREARGGQTAAV